MTMDEYIKVLDKRIAAIDKIGPGLFVAVKSVQALQVERIFESGLASDNTKIGQYNSTDPLYVSNQNSPIKGSGKGKPNLEGKSKKTKTTYYESYKDYRATIGRESGFVNLRLFGRLQSDLANAPIQVNENTYDVRVSSESYGKLKGNEKRFGKKITRLTDEENKTYLKVLNFELNKIIYTK